MQATSNYMANNHAQIVKVLNEETPKMNGITFTRPFTYSPEAQTIYSGVHCKKNDKTMKLVYDHEDGSTHAKLQNMINLDFAQMYITDHPQDTDFHKYQIAIWNASLREVEVTVSTKDGKCWSKMDFDPRDDDETLRIYNFATGKLNIGLIEKTFELRQGMKCETRDDEEKLMQMPFVKLPKFEALP